MGTKQRQYQKSTGLEAEPNLPLENFVAAFRGHPGGVTVVTADAGEGPVGLTATSVSSVSADPPLLVFSISEQSSSAPALKRAQSVVVHFIDEDRIHLAKLCATSGIDRFADTALWSRLPSGEPYFVDASTWIRGEVIQRVDVGTATLLVVRAIEARIADDASPAAPVIYHHRAWHRVDGTSRVRE